MEDFYPAECNNYSWEELIGFHAKYGLRVSRRDTTETLCERLLEYFNRQRKIEKPKRKRQLYELPETSDVMTLDRAEATKQIRINLATQLALDASKSEREARLSLADALLNDRFQTEKCDFDYIKSTSWFNLEKHSSSDTSVVFGEIDDPVNKAISIKVSLKPKNLLNDNSLVIEQLNYKHVVNSLIEYKFTPHLIAYIGSFMCNNSQLKRNLPTDVYEHIVDDLFPDNKKPNSQQKYSFLVTEKAQNAKELEDWLWNVDKKKERFPSSENTPNLLQIKSVLFQVLYNFAVFNRIGFRHNDAHLGNIFVEDKSGTDIFEKTAYVLDGDVYIFPTKRNFTKMYDFDRSGVNCNLQTDNDLTNEILDAYDKDAHKYAETDNCTNRIFYFDFIDNLGAGSEPNERYDTCLTLLWMYWKMQQKLDKYDGKVIPTHIIEYFELWKDEILPFIYKHMKHVISISAEGDEEYEDTGGAEGYKPTYWIKGDLNMSTPLEMIQDSFFNVGKQNETWTELFERKVTGLDSRIVKTMLYPTYTLPTP